MNHTSPTSIATPAPPANTRSQVMISPPAVNTPGQKDGGRSGYGPKMISASARRKIEMPKVIRMP